MNELRDARRRGIIAAPVLGKVDARRHRAGRDAPRDVPGALARHRLLVAALLAMGGAAGAALVSGAAWLTGELPGGLAVGNLLAALGLCAIAAASLVLSPRGAALRIPAIAALACAVAWLPVSVALAGNLALDFHDGRGAAWLGFTQTSLALVAGTFAWALFAALRRRILALAMRRSAEKVTFDRRR